MADKRWLGSIVATGRLGETTDPDAVQSNVDAWFDTHTHTWLSVYEGEDLTSVIYRARRDLALAWVNDLHLPPAATVLELACVMAASIGFGPFTLLGQHVLRATSDLELHRRLQQLADQHRFGLRWAGSQYVVLARKREAGG